MVPARDATGLSAGSIERKGRHFFSLACAHAHHSRWWPNPAILPIDPTNKQARTTAGCKPLGPSYFGDLMHLNGTSNPPNKTHAAVTPEFLSCQDVLFHFPPAVWIASSVHSLHCHIWEQLCFSRNPLAEISQHPSRSSQQDSTIDWFPFSILIQKPWGYAAVRVWAHGCAFPVLLSQIANHFAPVNANLLTGTLKVRRQPSGRTDNMGIIMKCNGCICYYIRSTQC